MSNLAEVLTVLEKLPDLVPRAEAVIARVEQIVADLETVIGDAIGKHAPAAPWATQGGSGSGVAASATADPTASPESPSGTQSDAASSGGTPPPAQKPPWATE